MQRNAEPYHELKNEAKISEPIDIELTNIIIPSLNTPTRPFGSTGLIANLIPPPEVFSPPPSEQKCCDAPFNTNAIRGGTFGMLIGWGMKAICGISFPTVLGISGCCCALVTCEEHCCRDRSREADRRNSFSP